MVQTRPRSGRLIIAQRFSAGIATVKSGEPAKRATEMSENKNEQLSSISNARSLEEIAEYWNSHSLADHWEQTHEVDFEIRAPHRITLDPEVYIRLEEQAESRGVP